MLRPLTNTFGIETCCFVCDPDNQDGLRIQFVHDDEAGEVVATASFGDQHSGAPRLVHGGVLAAVCDDASAWAAIALGRRFAMTAESRFSYVTPLPVEREVRVRARLIGLLGSQLWTSVDVRDGDGTVYVRAEMRATVLSGDLAENAGAGGGTIA